jgi:hypothetical protein
MFLLKLYVRIDILARYIFLVNDYLRNCRTEPHFSEEYKEFLNDWNYDLRSSISGFGLRMKRVNLSAQESAA